MGERVDLNESQEFIDLSSSTEDGYDGDDVPQSFFADLDTSFINFNEVCIQRIRPLDVLTRHWFIA